MKRFTFIFGFILLITLTASVPTKSQAVVDIGGTNNLILGGEIVPSTDYLLVITPSGNYVHNVTWYISLNNPFVPDHGINKVWLVTFEAGQVWFAEAKIRSNGKVHVVFHINGSGHYTPNRL